MAKDKPTELEIRRVIKKLEAEGRVRITTNAAGERIVELIEGEKSHGR